MAQGDARVGKWRGNWRMQWVTSTLHTTSEHGVCSITTADAHTSAASSRLNWRPPADLNGLGPFRRKTKSGVCAYAITFQLASVRRWTLSIAVTAVVSCCRFSRNWDVCLRTLDVTSFSRMISPHTITDPLRLTKPAGHVKVINVSASSWLKGTVDLISFTQGVSSTFGTVRAVPNATATDPQRRFFASTRVFIGNAVCSAPQNYVVNSDQQTDRDGRGWGIPRRSKSSQSQSQIWTRTFQQ